MATDIAGPTKTVTPASNSFKAIVRSLMPFVLSGAAALIARLGYHVSLQTTTLILGVAGGALTVVLHLLETKFPWVGAFLGYIGAPVYAPSKAKVKDAMIATLEAQVATLMAKASEASNPSTPTAAPVVTPVASEPAPAPTTPAIP